MIHGTMMYYSIKLTRRNYLQVFNKYQTNRLVHTILNDFPHEITLHKKVECFEKIIIVYEIDKQSM